MKTAKLAESFNMSCEVHGMGAGNMAVVAAMPNTSFYERGLLHPLIDYDQPRDYQNRIDDEMDDVGHVHFRDTPGLGQDLNLDYIEGNLVRPPHCGHPRHQKDSTMHRHARILVDVHPELRLRVGGLRNPSLAALLQMNNLHSNDS
jgi:hypothetical protein